MASVRIENHIIVADLQVFFWKKRIPLVPASQGKTKPKKTSKKRTPQQRSKQWIRKIKPLLQSFQVRKCRLRLDTDDFILNSYLFPFFYFLKSEQRDISINYQGKFLFQLTVENRLYRMVKALLF